MYEYMPAHRKLHILFYTSVGLLQTRHVVRNRIELWAERGRSGFSSIRAFPAGLFSLAPLRDKFLLIPGVRYDYRSPLTLCKVTNLLQNPRHK